MSFATEYTFTLPRGYVDEAGQVQRDGVMRLAVALDEIESAQDPRVQANEAFLPVLLLSRVITQLGNLPLITPHIVAQFFVIDLAFLEDLYERINNPEPVIVSAACPQCSAQFELQVSPLGAG